jgi:GntR family transcriptional regulator
MEINKNIPVPFYYQLKEILQNDIIKGVYKPGDLIPTELMLMEQYELSRTTVRQAINALVYEGYLSRRKGVGTTVIPSSNSGDIVSISNQIRKKGLTLSTQLLSLETVRADDSIAQRLDISQGDNVYIMERIRSGDNIPLVFTRTFIAEKTAPKLKDNIDTAVVGFHKYLSSIGKEIKQINRATEGGITDDKTAKMLGLKKGTPIIILTDRCYGSQGNIVEYTVSLVNTNVIKIIQTIKL